MDAEIALARVGHRATRAELLTVIDRKELSDAVRTGAILRVGHGRYATRYLADARLAAHRHTAVASHLSAALVHGWKVHTAPERPVITVPRNRKVNAKRGKDCIHHWADLTPAERKEGVTEPLRTVLDCARSLPFAEALCVADQALRTSRVGKEELELAAARLRGPGAKGAVAVAVAADGRSFNPLESTLRAISLRVPRLALVPQHTIRGTSFRFDADLADPVLRLVVEAEGYETHGSRAAFKSDCRRFTLYAVNGWTVLRFAYEHVMFEGDWVEEMLIAVVDELLARGRVA